MANTDFFIKGARRFSTTIGVGGVADASAATIPITTFSSDYTDGDVVAVVIDRVDISGTLTPSQEEVVIGVKSGSNLINCLRGVEGTAQSHSAGAVVEIKLFKSVWNRLIEGLVLEHGQDGTHDATKIVKMTGNQTIAGIKTFSSSPVVPAPTTDLQVATKKYVDDNAGAGGKYVFIIPGTAATGTDVAGTWFAPDAITIDSVDLYLDTAGATGSMIVDLNKNGTTLFSTQGNRPTLADTATVDTGNVPDVTSAAANDKITVDIDQITTTPGVDTYVVVKYS